MMFHRLFMLLGPTWSMLALLALLLAYFAFVAAQTARAAQRLGGEPLPDASPRVLWRRELQERLHRLRAWFDRARSRRPLDSGPHHSRP